MTNEFVALMGQPLASEEMKVFFEKHQIHYPITQYFSVVDGGRIFRFGRLGHKRMMFELFHGCSPSQEGKFSPILTQIAFDERDKYHHLAPIADFDDKITLSRLIGHFGEPHRIHDTLYRVYHIWHVPADDKCYWKICYVVCKTSDDDDELAYDEGEPKQYFEQVFLCLNEREWDKANFLIFGAC